MVLRDLIKELQDLVGTVSDEDSSQVITLDTEVRIWNDGEWEDIEFVNTAIDFDDNTNPAPNSFRAYITSSR